MFLLLLLFFLPLLHSEKHVRIAGVGESCVRVCVCVSEERRAEGRLQPICHVRVISTAALGGGGLVKHEKDKFDGEKRRAEEDSGRPAWRLEPTEIRGQRRPRAAFHVRLKVQHCSAASRCAISTGADAAANTPPSLPPQSDFLSRMFGVCLFQKGQERKVRKRIKRKNQGKKSHNRRKEIPLPVLSWRFVSKVQINRKLLKVKVLH